MMSKLTYLLYLTAFPVANDDNDTSGDDSSDSDDDTPQNAGPTQQHVSLYNMSMRFIYTSTPLQI